MGGLIEAASGVLDRRLLVSRFVPLLGLLIALAVMAASAIGWAATVRWWTGLSAEARVLLPLAVLVLSLLISQLLAAGHVGLVRFYTGYWDGFPIGRKLAAHRREHHQDIQRGLTEEDPEWHVYPADPDQVMPTTLGNILRGAEQHSSDRYALNAVTTWPRLYPTLPDAFRQTFAAAAAELDLAVTISSLGAVFSVVCAAAGPFVLPWYGTLLGLSGGVLVALLGYHAALRAGEGYGRLFRAAFDVHRWCLLDAMGLDRPTGFASELAQWRALDLLWVRGGVGTAEAPHLGYPQPEPLVVVVDAAQRTAADHTGPSPRNAGEPNEQPPDATADVQVAIPRQRPRFRGRPIAAVLSIVAFVGCAAITVGVATGKEAPRTARALGAYHQLTAADVEGPRAGELLNRYTLRPLDDEARIRPADLGPRLKPGSLGNAAITSLAPPWAPGGNAAVQPGAVITLRILPKGEHAALIVPNILVIDVSGPSGKEGIIVALPRNSVGKVVDRLTGGGRYAVTVPG